MEKKKSNVTNYADFLKVLFQFSPFLEISIRLMDDTKIEVKIFSN